MVPAASAAPAGFSIKGSSSTFDVGHPFEGERTSSVNVRQEADGSFKGHVNITVTITPNGSTYSKTHGDVVCIEATSGVSGGDGYEVRYVVTKASGGAAVAVGRFDSIFVRDDAAGDQTDQVFPVANWLDDSCGLSDGSVDWDDSVKGDLKVSGALLI